MEKPVISYIANMVKALSSEEARSLWGVRGQVEQLGIELNRMQSLLEDLSGIRSGGAMSQNWVVEATELANESQDIIDTFLLEAKPRREGGVGPNLERCACIFHEWFLVLKVWLQIKTINGKIKSFNRSLEVHGIRTIGESSSSSASQSQPDWRKTYHHLKEYTTAGLDEDAEMVVKKLVEDNNCRVVSIYGMGGLGKTTLARKVFQHREVESHFAGGIAWACISQQYDRGDILRGILTRLDPEMKTLAENMRDDELLEQLYQVQRERECLVVLDDIWSIDAWSSFENAFPIAESISNGSKILITTRFQALGPRIHPSCFGYQPRYLDEEESWNLLKSKAFGTAALDGTEREVDPDMEKEGRKMAKNCRGLPLAITLLGGLLATKPTLMGWQMVYRAIQSQRINESREDYLTKVLALSYDDLPYKYKACFIYFSNFPEDYIVPTEKLYLLWIAESLVSIDDKLEEETMMDVTERYLDELVKRCIVQVQVKKSTGRFKNCHMHDRMRDLCLMKAKTQNFLSCVHLQAETDRVGCSSASTTTKIRRLAVHLGGDVKRVQLPESETYEHLRSMLFFAQSEAEIELESNFKNFKLLRTLDLQQCRIGEKSVLEDIGKLIRLRYLSFRSCELRMLPSFINLRYLQTLDLRYIRLVSKDSGLPEVDLQNMKHLRHLYVSVLTGKFKLDGLTNLETLETFDTAGCKVDDLCKLTNLRQLDARFSMHENQSLEVFVRYLCNSNAHHLRQTSFNITTSNMLSDADLILLGQLFGSCGHLYKFYSLGRLPRLPEFSSSRLINLALTYSELEEDPMPTLEKLPKLQKLALECQAFRGDTIVCSANGFPQLKSLFFEELRRWKHWRVEKGAMPNLSTLMIYHCRELKIVPEGLRSITTLEQISVVGMPREFKEWKEMALKKGKMQLQSQIQV